MAQDLDLNAEVEQLTSQASGLIAAGAVSSGPMLAEVTKTLAELLATALAYELNDLKRAQRQANIEAELPRAVEVARQSALQFEASAAGLLN